MAATKIVDIGAAGDFCDADAARFIGAFGARPVAAAAIAAGIAAGMVTDTLAGVAAEAAEIALDVATLRATFNDSAASAIACNGGRSR